MLQIIVSGLLANSAIGAIAVKRKSLKLPDGFVAAAVLGFTIYLASPMIWIALMVFFVSSSVLTRFKEDSSEKKTAMNFAEKGGERDAIQVLANGGGAFLASIIMLSVHGIASSPILGSLHLFALSIVASSQADTWATEIGTTSPKEPVWILNPLKRVPRGTSGGVSPRGLVGTTLGAALISGVYQLSVFSTSGFDFLFFVLVSFGGILGSLTDTILGASVQSVYYCPQCGKETEKRVHYCGTTTEKTRGLRWINNDTVNFTSGILAALVVTFLFNLL